MIILVGCYLDSIKSRLLTRSTAKLKNKNVKGECLERCRWQRYPLAGLHNKDCYCGDTSIDDLIEFKVDAQHCKRNHEANLTMTIYHTGSLSSGNTFTVPSTLQDRGKTYITTN